MTVPPVLGTGKKALKRLGQQTAGLRSFRQIQMNVYPHQIVCDCLSHIEAFRDNGDTKEEMKMASEKIVGDESIRVTVTAMRFSVFRCHPESLNIETGKKMTANAVRAVLADTAGVTVHHVAGKNIYPFPVDAADKDETHVGRIRKDETLANGINTWVVSDNLRKGAARNTLAAVRVGK